MTRHHLRSFIAFGCILYASSSVWAQNVSIQTQLNRSEIRIGEPAVIDMIIRTDNLPQTQFHLREDEAAERRFRILEFGAVDTVDLGQGLKEIKAKLILTSFDSTLITIPPIIVTTPSGQAESKALALNVISPEVDLSKPEEIKPIVAPWEEPYTLLDLIWIMWSSWVSYLLAALLLVAILIYEYRHRASYRIMVKPIAAPKLSILELFAMRIEELHTEGLESQEDFKRYFSELTEALRLYIQTLFSLETAELTSSELLAALRQRGLHPEQLAKLEAILSQADFVKFAKSLPMPSEAQQAKLAALATAREFDAHHRSTMDLDRKEGLR